MSDYIGTRKQVDEYVGSRLVEAAYLGSRKYYDAYSEVSGSLPLVYESRVEHVLKNYVLYGTRAVLEWKRRICATVQRLQLETSMETAPLFEFLIQHM